MITTKDILADYGGFELVLYQPSGDVRIEHAPSGTCSAWLSRDEAREILAEPRAMVEWDTDLPLDNHAAFSAARAEGLRYFSAHMDMGGVVAFVGREWEDGGFHANGNTVRDSRGNTVRRFSIEVLDPTDSEHVAQVNEWWGAEA